MTINAKINKKGVSPLIATVLLIGFTVALAGVVITCGGGFTERITSGTEERTSQTLACTGDLNFEIEAVKCPSTIIIENKGRLRIEKISLRFFDSAGNPAGTQSIGALEKYELKAFTLDPVIPKGTIKVEALASLIVEGQEVTCGDSPRSKMFSPACQTASGA